MRVMIFNLIWAIAATWQISGMTESPPDPKAKIVVLVHGIFDNSRAMTYLRKALEKEGYRCVVPSLIPNDGRKGIADLATKLGVAINASIGEEARFSIVAFSMGGIVSRNYLLEQGGLKRCDSFISISSPHQGTAAAFCYPGRGVQDMRPNSELLTRMRARDNDFAAIRCYSYRTPLDLIILPASSSEWAPATNRSLVCLIHPLMLFDRRVAGWVIEDLKR